MPCGHLHSLSEAESCEQHDCRDGHRDNPGELEMTTLHKPVFLRLPELEARRQPSGFVFY